MTALRERLGVVGSGTIACGLAATAAQAGDVVLLARSEGAASRARDALRRTCARLDDPDAADRVRIATDRAQLARCTFVVEAVVEDRDAKAALLAELGRQVEADDAVLATTTSSLPVAELAAASGRPDRFVGLHVFNPVARMPLVELVHPDEASDRTRARARDLCAALGKTAVEVPDTPGFVVNRLLFPYLFDAVRLLEETGLPAQDVDACMTLGAGMPMGPLALLDLVGIDVAISIGEQLGLDVPRRLRSMAREGALGRKTGRGFHDGPSA